MLHMNDISTPQTDAMCQDDFMVNCDAVPSEIYVPAEFARGLEQKLALARRDIEVYRSALGYSISGDHDGRLSDGTIPHCGLCSSGYAAEKVNALEREAGHALHRPCED